MRAARCFGVLAAVLWLPGLVRAEFSGQVDELLRAPGLRYALVGIHVVDLTTGDVLYSRNADVRMMPASTQKLLTTAAAYDLLGGDFIYHTRVFAESRPDAQGRLKGPLYLKGSGDPTLTHRQLATLARGVREAGVRAVSGGIVVDATAFADLALGAGWSWDYLSNPYAAEVSALTVDGGCVLAVVRGAATAGQPPTLRLEPFSEYLTLERSATTRAGGPFRPGLYRHLGRNVLGLTGPIGVNERVQDTVTVRQPALYAGTLFKQALKQAQVSVTGNVESGRLPQDAAKLCQVDSPPLVEILGRINRNSDNNCAEAVLRTISLVKEGVGSRAASVRLVDRWVENLGGDSAAFIMHDGSGLSRLNWVTPGLLVQVLRHMAAKQEWVGTLAVMGKTGTLASRLGGTAAEGRVRAKTGSLSGVRALAGYAEGASGRRTAFSILVNGALDLGPAGHMQDRICMLLAGL